ncbi:MAG: 2-phospho-L-lactate transferase [Chloroflexaceae bacterium]|nr:2-phospho-L-lactate transferase [Chloroflexaceae bacterium]
MDIVTLAGGVGAARFLEGLVQVVPPASITAIVNTGDDFVLHDLHISPDLDIVTCTLAGLINPQQGWGLDGDSFACLEWLGRLGGPTWFQLGDRDLALHIRRTALLRAGQTLSQVTRQFRQALGVAVEILPMSNDPVPTLIVTPAGDIHFENYLVERRCRDQVLGVRMVDVAAARPAPGVLEAIYQAQLVVLAPSNPVVSIGPILAVPGIRSALLETAAPVVGISPIIGGAAVKGPAVALMQAMGMEASALGVAQAFADILDVFLIDTVDAHLKPAIEALGLTVVVTNTIMRGAVEKADLARAVVAWKISNQSM